MQREIAAAESAEREAAAAVAKAQQALRHGIGAAATPPRPEREQSVNSRSERPGDTASLDGSVQCMASSSRVEFAPKLGAAVVAKASSLLASVRKTSLHPPEPLSVRRAWYAMD